MATSEKPKRKEKVRLLVLSAILMVAVIFASIKLMNIQVVHGEENAVKADSNNLIRTNVEAARGEILDRYGRPLVTNSLVLNIQLNRGSLPEGKENEVILRLTQLFQKQGAAWRDEFPITEQPVNGEYQFKDGMDSEIEKLKSMLKMQDYGTAQQCMDNAIEKFEINGYNEQDTRTIVAIRCMMEVENFSDRNPYTFAENVDKTFAAQLIEMQNEIPGVEISETYTRGYVDGTLAPHILGNIGPMLKEDWEGDEESGVTGYKDIEGYNMDDDIGRTGIEALMESDLKGTDGVMILEKDADGTVVNQYMEEEAKPGNNVVLTIDSVLQKQIQDQFYQRLSQHSAITGGSVVVLDTSDNSILASVSYPGYDLNTMSENYDTLNADPKKPMLNRSFKEIYRPGSTYKTAMAVAGVSEGIMTGTSKPFNCTKTMYLPGDTSRTPFNCLSRHGYLNLYDALKVSCNIYFYNVGKSLQEIDEHKITEYSNALGLGTDIGLELSNATGRITSKETAEKLGIPWNGIGDAMQSAIGQMETYVTPVQMATQMATIANKGIRYNTHIIKQVDKFDGSETVKQTEKQIMNQLEDKNNAFEETTKGMESVSTKYPEMSGMNIAIKTGTPQRTKTVYDSAAVAFYPAEQPEIAIAVVIERGDGISYAKDMVVPVIQAYEASKQSAQQWQQEHQNS